ncbi:MAG: hypothetical protein M1824_001076 [Vezdaea acicularis]|nr:MAG: hypothetical protein M1824_001076 [Vezdaea acicularis]
MTSLASYFRGNANNPAVITDGLDGSRLDETQIRALFEEKRASPDEKVITENVLLENKKDADLLDKGAFFKDVGDDVKSFFMEKWAIGYNAQLCYAKILYKYGQHEEWDVMDHTAAESCAAKVKGLNRDIRRFNLGKRASSKRGFLKAELSDEDLELLYSPEDSDENSDEDSDDENMPDAPPLEEDAPTVHSQPITTAFRGVTEAMMDYISSAGDGAGSRAKLRIVKESLKDVDVEINYPELQTYYTKTVSAQEKYLKDPQSKSAEDYLLKIGQFARVIRSKGYPPAWIPKKGFEQGIVFSALLKASTANKYADDDSVVLLTNDGEMNELKTFGELLKQAQLQKKDGKLSNSSSKQKNTGSKSSSGDPKATQLVGFRIDSGGTSISPNCDDPCKLPNGKDIEGFRKVGTGYQLIVSTPAKHKLKIYEAIPASGYRGALSRYKGAGNHDTMSLNHNSELKESLKKNPGIEHLCHVVGVVSTKRDTQEKSRPFWSQAHTNVKVYFGNEDKPIIAPMWITRTYFKQAVGTIMADEYIEAYCNIVGQKKPGKRDPEAYVAWKYGEGSIDCGDSDDDNDKDDGSDDGSDYDGSDDESNHGGDEEAMHQLQLLFSKLLKGKKKSKSRRS